MLNRSESMLAMLNKMSDGKGFIAALDQSGGSTPKALALYGIDQNQYSSDEQMYDLVHQMRTRIVTNRAFNGDRILGAILFENTLNRTFNDKSAAHYLWQEKQVVPLLKVDKGLCEQRNGVQLMKAMPELELLLDRAVNQGVFGTKMRSVILLANETGIKQLVSQQFQVAKQILAKGLIPIIEPEIDINSPEKSDAEALLKATLLAELDQLVTNEKVMLKLTIPNSDNFYTECIHHKNVLRVVALSGGYTREVATEKIAKNNDMIASFSRALTQDLSDLQSDEEFTAALNTSIESIFKASIT